MHPYCINFHIRTRAPCRTGSSRHAGKRQLLFLFPGRSKHTDPYHSSRSLEKTILQIIRWSAEPPITPEQPVSNLDPAPVMTSVFCFTIYRTRRRRGAVIYLDLQKAFELVNKHVILAELATARLHGRLLAWTTDFLTDKRAVFKTTPATLRVMRMALPKGVLLVQLFSTMPWTFFYG